MPPSPSSSAAAALAADASSSNKTRLTATTEGKVAAARKIGDASIEVRDFSPNSQDFCKPESVPVDFVKQRCAPFKTTSGETDGANTAQRPQARSL